MAWTLFARTFDARPDRIDFRDLPFRPRLVSLPPQHPSPEQIRRYLPAYGEAGLILDQGNEGACTGFGLAAVVNYLRWEGAVGRAERIPSVEQLPKRVSAQMLYHNAQLYDEWKGEDYEGSSCRGAMKGFHKHGVCTERYWPNTKKGKAREGWDADAPMTPLGAYYRIDGRSLVEMQSAVHETHAIYVSGDAHDGWDRLKKCRSLEEATIRPPRGKDVGGHAFAIVGYTCDGFIVQNSWGPDWGFHGFALLPYEDWTRNGSDAWALALGAPMAISIDVRTKGKGAVDKLKFTSPAARTEISLDERLRVRSPLLAGKEKDPSAAPPWVNGEEALHIITIGHHGLADRDLVAAADGTDAVRMVVEDGIRKAVERGVSKVAIYDHGGLNSRDDGIKRAQILGPWFEANGIFPIFVVWQTGFFESAGDIIKSGIEKLGVPAERVEGWLIDRLKDAKDRAFEVFAREFGVKAIWENMKSRAQGASQGDGGLVAAAKSIKSAFAGMKKPPEIHLLGHSAGAIMHGYFLAAMKAKGLEAQSIHLWAPACTVQFATTTYGAAFAAGVADSKTTYIDVLSDANERSDSVVPLAYSKSLLYLISRALEPDRKTPILGMQKIWPSWSKNDETFMDGYQDILDAWYDASKGVVIDPPVEDKSVSTRREPHANETIPANHGSFDNNVDVVNRAIRRIVGKQPRVPVTDLRGF